MSQDKATVDPRVRRSRAAVLEAARAELAERGYGGFAIDGVAVRASVARSTVYRLWPDRHDLIADAMESLNRQPSPRPPQDERARERVVAIVQHLAEAMVGSRVAACLPALIDGAERDPRVRALHHGYNDRRRGALVAALALAQERGEVDRDHDPDLAAVALAGAVIYRRLMTAHPLQPSEVRPLVETVLGPDPSRS